MCHFAEFLIHAPCMKQATDDHEHCAHRYQQKIGKVYEKVNEQEMRPANGTTAEKDFDMRTICW